MLVAAIIAAVVVVGIAIKRRTAWWIPGATLLAGAGLLTIDAILLPDQQYGYVLRLVELWGACVSALVGAALLHAVAWFRRRRARLATTGTTKRTLDWPSARIHHRPTRRGLYSAK